MSHIESAVGGVEISFRGLEHSGSAGVALMMSLFRSGHRLGKSVSFVDIPADLRNIIELTELDDVLPLEAAVADAATTGPAAANQEL